MFFINLARQRRVDSLKAVAVFTTILLWVAVVLNIWPFGFWHIFVNALIILICIAGFVSYYTNLQTQKKVQRGVTLSSKTILHRLLRKSATELQRKIGSENSGEDQLRHLAQVIEIALDTGFYQPSEIVQILSDLIVLTIVYDVTYTEETYMFRQGALIVSVGDDRIHRLPIWN